MVEWKTYRITGKEICSENIGGGLRDVTERVLLFIEPQFVKCIKYIKFGLDGYVRYRDGNEKYVCCKNDSPFNNWRVGDYIEVDNDQTHYEDNEYKHANNTYIRFTDAHCSRTTCESLRIKCSSLESEISNLCNDRDRWKREYGKIEGERNKWKRDFDNKNIENEANKQQLEQEKRNRQNEVVKHANEIAGERLKSGNEKSVLQIENTRLQQESNNKSVQLTDKTRDLDNTKEELNLVRAENTKLQLESSQKNSELQEKFKELKLKDAEISLLKNQAGLSQEELLKLKIRFEERNLEQFATELKINLEQLNSLSEFHERLFTAHKEHNQDNVINQKANIAQIKQKLLDKEISITNIQEICEKCEKIAEFNWKLSQVNQTKLIDNNQEKDWKNINPNFTPELVQEWIKHGFIYEQCQEWINISAPEKHNLVIKEPAYYAWLRDVKKMKSEEVLNYGDSQELNREYLEWYQEQEQQQFETKQEIPTNN